MSGGGRAQSSKRIEQLAPELERIISLSEPIQELADGGRVAELVEIGIAASPAGRGYRVMQQGQCIERLASRPVFASRPPCAW
jgi:hypothetical protein